MNNDGYLAPPIKEGDKARNNPEEESAEDKYLSQKEKEIEEMLNPKKDKKHTKANLGSSQELMLFGELGEENMKLIGCEYHQGYLDDS